MDLNPCTRSIFACLRRWWLPFALKPPFGAIFEKNAPKIKNTTQRCVFFVSPSVRRSAFVERAVPCSGKPASSCSPAYTCIFDDCCQFPCIMLYLLSWAVINGPRATTSRKTMRERVPPLQNSKNGHQRWAASPPTLRAGFSSLGGVERVRA